MTRRRRSSPLSKRVVLGLVLALAAAIQTGQPQRAEAFIVIDVSNLVQNIISAIQQITAVAQQVEQISNEATQIANQIQMLRDLVDQASQLGSPTWGNVQSQIAALASAVNIGQSLYYSLPNIQAQFQAQFPGYVPPTNWQTQYQQWSQITLDTLNGTLRSAGLNTGDFADVQAALDTLRSANNGASGRNELMQVANSLASLQVAEFTKMRQLMALEINAQTVSKAQSTNNDAAAEAAMQKFIGTPATVVDPRSQPGFNSF